MTVTSGIPRVRQVVLLTAVIALFGAFFVVTAHRCSDAHCGLEEPDHHCDLCRSVAGNPVLAAAVPDLPQAGTHGDVIAAPTPAERRIEQHLPPGRAPPVTVRAT